MVGSTSYLGSLTYSDMLLVFPGLVCIASSPLLTKTWYIIPIIAFASSVFSPSISLRYVAVCWAAVTISCSRPSPECMVGAYVKFGDAVLCTPLACFMATPVLVPTSLRLAIDKDPNAIAYVAVGSMAVLRMSFLCSGLAMILCSSCILLLISVLIYIRCVVHDRLGCRCIPRYL